MGELAEDAEELVTYLGFHIDNLGQATDPEDIAVAADSACAYFQGLGICELLLDAELDPFFHHMIRSGRSRRWLLRRAQKQAGFPVKILKPSNTRGLFGALVAADWALAKEIADLSAQRWDDQWEYEDDFCYAHLLHRRLAGDPEPVQRALLGEYARALDGDEPPRFRLCRGLLDRDGEATAAAFTDLLADRREEMKELGNSVMGSDELFGPFSAVYVEGLAWLRLLDQAGLPTESEYPFCPSLARVTEFGAYVPGGFPD
jgi:hypothetical protein